MALRLRRLRFRVSGFGFRVLSPDRRSLLGLRSLAAISQAVRSIGDIFSGRLVLEQYNRGFVLILR